MTTEEKILKRIFGEISLWKNKYEIDWCDHCGTAIIKCPVCKNTSCNSGSCKECLSDFIEFCKNTKHSVEQYLTQDEIKVYMKAHQIKKFILQTLEEGSNEIDWKDLDKRGELSQIDCEFFLDGKSEYVSKVKDGNNL